MLSVNLPQCTCWDKAPTVPTCRDQMTHLGDCPAKVSGLPVGLVLKRTDAVSHETFPTGGKVTVSL